MRSARLWAGLLGVEQAVVEQVCFDEDEQALVVSVRPRKGVRRRCGRCGRRCPGFDQGEGRRRWRALDLGVVSAATLLGGTIARGLGGVLVDLTSARATFVIGGSGVLLVTLVAGVLFRGVGRGPVDA